MQMQDKLERIATKSQQDKKSKFTSLAHLINEQNLVICFRELQHNKACGIDGVTVDEYGENLKVNLQDLVHRLKTKDYKPQPVKRVYIPKPGRKEKRPLGIPTVEDKLVQTMVKKILEAIYEPNFLDCSHGFRPKRNCHSAVRQVTRGIITKPTRHIVEVDIEKFFDKVQHYWLLRCLEERINDPNFLWLIKQFLKAGVMEDGVIAKSGVGTPQGGVVSPTLANIYLHYVLDLWFKHRFAKKTKGLVELVRYCDDFVVLCQFESDASFFLSAIRKRFAKFGLKVSEEKTGLIKFGRHWWWEWKRTGFKPKTFDFLGFTLYCGTSRRGKFIVGMKTSKKNLARKLKEINLWLMKIRNYSKLKSWWITFRSKLVGHYQYFGVPGNMRCLRQFYSRVIRLAFRWINRRSQKMSMNRYVFYKIYLPANSLPQPRICHQWQF